MLTHPMLRGRSRVNDALHEDSGVTNGQSACTCGFRIPDSWAGAGKGGGVEDPRGAEGYKYAYHLRFPPQSVSGYPYPCGGARLLSHAGPYECPSDPTASYCSCYHQLQPCRADGAAPEGSRRLQARSECLAGGYDAWRSRPGQSSSTGIIRIASCITRSRPASMSPISAPASRSGMIPLPTGSPVTAVLNAPFDEWSRIPVRGSR